MKHTAFYCLLMLGEAVLQTGISVSVVSVTLRKTKNLCIESQVSKF